VSLRFGLPAALVLAIALAGCQLLSSPAGLRTAQAPPQACMDALIVGKLVRHPASGLGIASPDGQLTAVEWPFGYSAREEGGRIALVDDRGQVIAREGDEISVGGGFGANLWHACGSVSVAVPGS
jgi:hypothetical protein